VSIAHWDEVEKQHRTKGPMDATWSRLGDAAGAKGVGVNRIEIAPGKLPTPPHSHGASEEIYYVLGGSGLAWQDEEVCEVGPGDCIVQLANNFEHTLRGGPDGLDVLVFGTRHPTEIGWLPRSNAIRIGYPWVEGRVDDPWDVEEQVGELEFPEPGARPANIVAADEVEERHGGTAARRHGQVPRRGGRGRAHGTEPAPPRRRQAGRPSALSLRRGGGLHRPRRPGDARALAVGRRRLAARAGNP